MLWVAVVAEDVVWWLSATMHAPLITSHEMTYQTYWMGCRWMKVLLMLTDCPNIAAAPTSVLIALGAFPATGPLPFAPLNRMSPSFRSKPRNWICPHALCNHSTLRAFEAVHCPGPYPVVDLLHAAVDHHHSKHLSYLVHSTATFLPTLFAQSLQLREHPLPVRHGDDA